MPRAKRKPAAIARPLSTMAQDRLAAKEVLTIANDTSDQARAVFAGRAEEAAQLLVRIMRDENCSGRLRLDAATQLLDRGLGKAAQTITVDSPAGDLHSLFRPDLDKHGLRYDMWSGAAQTAYVLDQAERLATAANPPKPSEVQALLPLLDLITTELEEKPLRRPDGVMVADGTRARMLRDRLLPALERVPDEPANSALEW